MAEVIFKLRVVPDDAELEIEKLRKDCEVVISKFGQAIEFEVEPFAFGMKILIFTVVIEEKAGGTDPLEEAILAVDGVSRAEAVGVRRLM